MPPKSANPKFQTLLDEINNFYFTKEMEGFDVLHHKNIADALKGTQQWEESSAHGEFFRQTFSRCNFGTHGEEIPLSANLYINKVEDAIDEWIKENKNYITNKEDLQNAFREFEKTDGCKNIKLSIINCSFITDEEKRELLDSNLLTSGNGNDFPYAIALSFENKVMVHQQRELFQKLENKTFERGDRENLSREREALEYGFALLCDRGGREGFGQSTSASWSIFSEVTGNANSTEQVLRYGKKLTNLFLEEDETLEENMKEGDEGFIRAVNLYNSGKRYGLLSESAKAAAKLEGKYIKIRRAGIKRVGKASLKWSIRKEITNSWMKESEEIGDELEKLKGTFSPFRKIIFSIEKAYYDRKAVKAFEEERNAATDYEKRYINNDSKVLLAKQEYEKFCNNKHVVSGRNAQLGKEDLEEFSKLILNFSKASYDAKMALGLNDDTLENSQNLWDKTNETISQMVSQNAADCQAAHEVNENRSVEIKEFINNRFEAMNQEEPENVFYLNTSQNTVDNAITTQTEEAPVQQQTQVLQPVIETESSN